MQNSVLIIQAFARLNCEGQGFKVHKKVCKWKFTQIARVSKYKKSIWLEKQKQEPEAISLQLSYTVRSPLEAAAYTYIFYPIFENNFFSRMFLPKNCVLMYE